MINAFYIAVILTIFTMPLQVYPQQAVQDSLHKLISEHLKEDDRKADLLNQLSYRLQFTNPKQGLIYAEEVIGFRNKLKNKRLLYSAYLEKGHNLLQLGEFIEALEYSQKALVGFTSENAKSDMAFAFANIGTIYNQINNYPKALDNLQQAAKLLKEEQHPQESVLYLNMATIYGAQENYKKALSYFDIARKEAVSTGDKLLEAYAVFNIGTVYFSQNMYRKGLSTLDTAHTLAYAIDDKSLIGRIYGNMGKTYNDLGEYDSAVYYLNYAIELNEKIGNKKSKALNTLNLGHTYLKTGNFPLAAKFTRHALQAGKDLETIDIQQIASLNMSEYFEKVNKPDSALYYYKMHITLRDSIDNEQNKQQLTRLEMQYDFDLKEQEYLKEQEVSKLQIRQIWLYGLIAVAIITVLAIYFIQRSRIRSIRLENEMKEKELLQRAESLLMEQRISESELKAIRSQMNPHFIFNVLNSIESYILDNDPKTASMLVQKFAALSRLVLENSTQSLVTLDREWHAVQRYVELESIRFDHRFSYTFAYQAGHLANTLLVPPMLIQPLLENAIHHGLRHLQDYKGELHTIISNTEDKIIITVTDNGIGLANAEKLNKPSAIKQQSVGIAAIKERIAIINARQEDSPASFELIDLYEAGGSGTQAVLVLPLVHTDKTMVTA